MFKSAIYLALFISWLSPARASQANPGVAISSLVATWSGSRQDTNSPPTITKVEWVWSNTADSELPALRAEVTVPWSEDREVKSLEGRGLIVVRHSEAQKELHVTVDLKEAKALLTIQGKDLKGKATHDAIAIQALVAQTFLIVHPDCWKAGIRVVTQSNSSRNLFAAVRCEMSDDTINVDLIRSEDSSFDFGGAPKENYFRTKFGIAASAQNKIEFTVKDRSDRKSTFSVENGERSVTDVKQLKGGRFTFYFGLGASRTRYHETAVEKALSQYSLSGKGGAALRLGDASPFDLVVTGFGTLLPVWMSAQEFPSARFYGINTRVGYILPTNALGLEYKIQTGWYFWGMRVSAASNDFAYGVADVSGPQVFALVSRPGPRLSWIYGKLAVISDGPSNLLRWKNHDLATGFGINLLRFDPKSPSITADIIHTKFANETVSFTMMTFSVGIQTPL